MRKDPFGVGSFVHVIKRGARGGNIVRDEYDRQRFLKLLRYLNDANVPRNWERDITIGHIQSGYHRPSHWPIQQPYVSIVAFCLLDNHFHLLLREQTEGGVSKFMQRLCTSMAAYYNARHGERGTLFQGAYRARTVTDDDYLQYLAAYIQVKNVFEMHPRGLRRAVRYYDDAFIWATQYLYASLIDHADAVEREIVDRKLVRELLPQIRRFRSISREMVEGSLARIMEEDLE